MFKRIKNSKICSYYTKHEIITDKILILNTDDYVNRIVSVLHVHVLNVLFILHWVCTFAFENRKFTVGLGWC